MTWEPRWKIDDHAYLRPLCLAWAEEAKLDATELVRGICRSVLLGKFDHDGRETADGERSSGVGMVERREGLTETICFAPGKVIGHEVELLLKGSGEPYVGAPSIAQFVVITSRAVQRYAAKSGLPLPSWWFAEEVPSAETLTPEEPAKVPKRGRPSVIPTIQSELRRRAREGLAQPTQIGEMRELHRWFARQYPHDKHTPCLKTLTRKLGREYNALNEEPNK